jgi:SAM-dependent methyltransferase
VVGVDISEKMIEWSRLRAREEKVQDKVEFQVANVLDLPFEDDRFDAVIVESVLAFVDDKPRAIRECIRVTKPGGYVGLNESFWTKQPSPEMIALAQDSVGTSIPTEGTWTVLWEASGLHDRTVSLRRVDTRLEVRDRLRWVGRRWALRGFGRLLRLFITNPGMKQSVKRFFSGTALDTMQEIGYGLFVGRK